MINDYINYFRSLAISHKDLQHNPLSETGEADAASKHFTRIQVQEVIEGLSTQIGFPCLCLELYQTDSSEEGLSVKMQPRGAFMIIDHPASDSFAAEQEVYAKTEKILFEILQKIHEDHKPGSDMCARPFRSFSFNKMEIIPVGPIFTGEHGYRVEFDFQLQNTIPITQPPAPGTFI